MVVGRCALQVERIVHRLRQPFVALGDGVVDAVQLRYLAAEQDDGGACARAGDRRRAPEAAMRAADQDHPVPQHAGPGAAGGSRRHAHAFCTSATMRASSPDSYSRSEEHTSELQSLMRISYAVFCLKQKRKTHNHYQSKHTNITERHTIRNRP